MFLRFVALFVVSGGPITSASAIQTCSTGSTSTTSINTNAASCNICSPGKHECAVQEVERERDLR